jgi:hypothetical protein
MVGSYIVRADGNRTGPERALILKGLDKLTVPRIVDQEAEEPRYISRLVGIRRNRSPPDKGLFVDPEILAMLS